MLLSFTEKLHIRNTVDAIKIFLTKNKITQDLCIWCAI